MQKMTSEQKRILPMLKVLKTSDTFNGNVLLIFTHESLRDINVDAHADIPQYELHLLNGNIEAKEII